MKRQSKSLQLTVVLPDKTSRKLEVPGTPTIRRIAIYPHSAEEAIRASAAIIRQHALRSR